MAKKKCEYIDSEIEILDLDSEVLNILKDNNINTVGTLWTQNRKSLKGMGFKDTDIKHIIIKLQLLGLDLNKKIYN